MTPLLEARGLALGTRLNVDLAVEPGARIGIAGASGSGKSSLCRALLGLEPGLTGSLRHGDRELVGRPPSAWRALRREVALVWQDAQAALDPRLDAAAAIAEARVLAGRPALAPDELSHWLGRVGLEPHHAHRRPRQLSGGQCQRVQLARALVTDPMLLVADEPTSAVDRALALALAALLDRIVEPPRALVFVTHDLSLLPGLIRELVVLDGGRVVERGETERVMARPVHPATRALVQAIDALPPRRAADQP
jgi:peptide/nickel transport system ATP-binding protein